MSEPSNTDPNDNKMSENAQNNNTEAPKPVEGSLKSALSASVTSLDSVSSSVSRTGIPKPSGLRPPSKIGRMCAGQQQKAPVPTTPTKGELFHSFDRCLHAAFVVFV